MQSVSFATRSVTLFACIGLLFSGVFPLHGLTEPNRGSTTLFGSLKGIAYSHPITSVLSVVTFGLLVTKDTPNKERNPWREDLRKALKGDGWALWRLYNDHIVGFLGKKRGPRILGSKWVIEGDRKHVATEVYPGGEKIEFYKYDNYMPYGILGIGWAYLAYTLKSLKDLKDYNETLDYFGAYGPKP